MRKAVKLKITDAPSGTPIATLVSTVFFGGSEWDEGVSTADTTLVELLDARMVEEVGRDFVDVEADVILGNLTSADDEFPETVIAAPLALASHGRPRPTPMSPEILKTELSQHPPAAAPLPAFALQQNICV